MFERILVPLDGTNHSDQILLEVSRILIRQKAQVELYSVVAPDERDDKHPDLRMEEARRHLARQGEKLKAVGAEVSSDVELGDPADMILRRIERTKPWLVAMATHGRSGPSRWLRGSVATRVLRECQAPLLLVNPAAEEGVQGIQFKRILVPFDGSERATAIVPLVKVVALGFESEVILQRVWPYPEEGSQEAKDEMLASLKPVQDELREAGLEVRARLDFGFPAGMILKAVDEESADLVALASHGSSGLARWVYGSVAEKVLQNCPQPLLLVNTRPPKDEG